MAPWVGKTIYWQKIQRELNKIIRFTTGTLEKVTSMKLKVVFM